MNVNGVTSSQATSAYAAYSKPVADQSNKEAIEAKPAAETAAVYEPSNASDTTAAATKATTYKPNTDLINKLKSEAEQRTANLQSMVEKLITQQATTNGNATDIWSFLREGKFSVDPETKAAAQEAISEDGYWGVKQTSDRIVSFATALTGCDPDKLDDMIAAFKKGFKQAEKTWGGELPEISQKTYDAVLEKFEKLRQEANPVEA